MKRLITYILLLSICMIMVNSSLGQLSVTATAGNTGPQNYTTLKSVIDAVNAGTHMGSIVVSVTGNTIETETSLLNGSGTGSASFTSLLIKPAAATNPSISGNVPVSILTLNGAMNVTIDGSNSTGGTSTNLAIVNEGITGSVIVFINGASYNVIKNSILKSGFKGPPHSSTIFIAGSTAATGNNYNTIENNDITKNDASSPDKSIVNTGGSGRSNKGNIIRRNRIYDFISFAYVEGFASPGFTDSTLVEGNEFYNTAPQVTPLTVIFIEGSPGVRNLRISKNKIFNLATSASQIVGIMLYEAGSVMVDNNMILLSHSASDLIGISQETDDGADIKIYHNTIHISGTTNDRNSFAFLKNWFSTGDDIRDNMFINTRQNNAGVKGQYAMVKLNTGSFTSNYNNLYSAGNTNNYVAFTNVSSNPIYYSTLSAWQTGTLQDANSISVLPVFVSPSDLHLVTTSNNSIDNLGTPIASVLTDFDGQGRSTTTPDMGADEFISTGGCILPSVATQPVAITVCIGQPANFSVVAAGTGPFSYQWKKNGTNISGATNNNYSIALVASSDAGNYQVVITGFCGNITSNTAALSVNNCTGLPVLNTELTGLKLLSNPIISGSTVRVNARIKTKIHWRIIDMKGRLVMEFESQLLSGQNDIEINLSHLSTGVYQLYGETSRGRSRMIRLVRL